MKFRELGPSGIQASVVGIGTWAIGGWMWGGVERADAIKAIHTAIDEGVTLIDTAPVYGFGVSEELVGEAVRDRRDRVVLATKCGMIWHEARGNLFFTSDENHPTKKGTIKVYQCLAPDTIRYEVEQSLRRLHTDHIDLLQTHWQDPSTPISDTMTELLKLKEKGKIRAIGCSNATPAHMDEYQAVGQLDTDQELFSMLDRKHEEANLPACAQRGLGFLAYSPLGQGLLTGKVGPERTFGNGDQRNFNARFSPENREKIQTMLDLFEPIAGDKGISLTQLVIAWTFSQPGCTHTLVGARSQEQARENAAAGDVTLSEGELETMRAAIEQYAL
ncbi:MAG: aldo/keto reductase [Gemmatimonadales bacterium]|nr:MAG: aldo/keto reductase [Gemmatimonadales bacterium]